jgi:hypothetical protein
MAANMHMVMPQGQQPQQRRGAAANSAMAMQSLVYNSILTHTQPTQGWQNAVGPAERVGKTAQLYVQTIPLCS